MAKASTARVARKMAAKQQQTETTPQNSDATRQRVTKLDNVTKEALVADVRSTLDKMIERVTDNVKANQRIAYDILLHREKMALDGIAPVDLSGFKMLTEDTDTKPLTKWRTYMADTFIGKKPTARGGMDQSKVDGKDDYSAKRDLLDNACNLVVILVNNRCNSDNYNEETGCFAVPGECLIPRDDAWTPDFDLAEAINAGALIPLLNKSYFLRVGTKRTRTVRSSVKQMIDAWKSKPRKQASGSGEDNDGDKSDGGGANERGSIDTPAVTAAMKVLPFTTLLRPFWNNLADTRKQGWNPEDYGTQEWNDILNIAAAFNSLIQLKADKDKANANADNVTPIRKRASK